MLGTAIGCILSNAAKFNKKNGTIVLTLSNTVSNGKAWLAIECADTGIGMSAQMRESLFKGFSQGESPLTRHYEGIGVGMYLAKRIMELLNGEIEVVSKEAEGTAVTLKLPV